MATTNKAGHLSRHTAMNALAMGAKEAQVTRDLCETLRKTGASAEITCTTMHGALKKVVNKNDCDIMKDVGRAVVEDGNYPSKFYLYNNIFD